MQHSDIFNLNLSRREAPDGSLLVAEPFMRESHFCHAVVLLIDGEDNPGGSMGVVMNRLTDLTLPEVLPNDIKPERRVEIYSGGPVGADRLFFLHTVNDVIHGGMPVCPGLWVGGDYDSMLTYINSGYPVEGAIRFFLGYSGWAKGQLSAELASQSWAVTTPLADPAEMLRGANDAYWHKVVRSMGPDFKAWAYHPQNPLSN